MPGPTNPRLFPNWVRDVEHPGSLARCAGVAFLAVAFAACFLPPQLTFWAIGITVVATIAGLVVAVIDQSRAVARGIQAAETAEHLAHYDEIREMEAEEQAAWDQYLLDVPGLRPDRERPDNLRKVQFRVPSQRNATAHS